MFQNNTLSDCLNENRNSFNLIRLIAALSVLISHAYVLLGQGDVRPLYGWTSYSIGQHAVNVFFVLSGLLLTRSLAHDANFRRFAIARILRIFPGLLGFGVTFAFVLGPLLTTLKFSDYFSDAHTYAYPLDLLFRFHEAASPHGIFVYVPVPQAINDSLWTIRYELLAYASLVMAYALGVLRTRLGSALCVMGALSLAVAIKFAWIDGQDTPFEQLTRYALCFLIGVNLFHWRDHIILQWWTILPSLAAIYLASGSPLAAPVSILFAAHLAIYLGARDFGALTAWSRKTDISYGTYIYGWPTQQILVTFCHNMNPIFFAILSMAVVPLFGLLSWTFVERPALQLKKVQLPGSAERRLPN